MDDEHLVLAGGGHTHALLLLRWALDPQLKPRGLITLVSLHTSTFYSGMIPGLMSGEYSLDDCLIDLYHLANKAKISFVRSEIKGVSLSENYLLLADRSPIYFDRLSLDIGSGIDTSNLKIEDTPKEHIMSVKPFSRVVSWLRKIDDNIQESSNPLTIIGSGLSAIEIAFALRKRWPNKKIQLQANSNRIITKFRHSLAQIDIEIVASSKNIKGQSLLCTGSKGFNWIKESGFPVDSSGRILTSDTLQVVSHSQIFAVGDCGVIFNSFRPPSGVWAVKAAKILSQNLQLCNRSLDPLSWKPQKRALQLVGGLEKSGEFTGWAFWGDFIIGPSPLLWSLKRFIDRKFISMFDIKLDMNSSHGQNNDLMECRGCAAKLPGRYLKEALANAQLSEIANTPEDSSVVASSINQKIYLQSVDGFPALVSDTWLNARLTALHASSDLWASGASVLSAQSIITLPKTSRFIQQELLEQSILGIKSALDLQNAKLIGGHTLETRNVTNDQVSLGVEISLSVNGFLSENRKPWLISGLKRGDTLMISRGIGTGVIFAASMAGKTKSNILEDTLLLLSKSQHSLLDDINIIQDRNSLENVIHACTDITGFGLLGHLSQMLIASNQLITNKNIAPLRIELYASKIPILNGAFHFYDQGFSSTLTPSNSDALKFLESKNEEEPPINLILGSIQCGSRMHQGILNLIVDPQTCGPLVISCSKDIACELETVGPWKIIGEVL